MATTIYYYIKDEKIYDMRYVIDKSYMILIRTIPKNDFIYANHHGNEISKGQVIMDLKR